MLEFLIIFAILAALVFVVGAPLRAAAAARTSDPSADAAHRNGRAPERSGDQVRRNGQPGPGRQRPADQRGGRSASEIPELEAARDAKYREIRDAELDYRTGKLSDADYEAIDHSLRAEALEILRALDRAGVAEE